MGAGVAGLQSHHGLFVLCREGDGVGDGVGSPVYRPSPGLEPSVLVAGKRAGRASLGQSEFEACSDRNVVCTTTRQDTLSSLSIRTSVYYQLIEDKVYLLFTVPALLHSSAALNFGRGENDIDDSKLRSTSSTSQLQLPVLSISVQ